MINNYYYPIYIEKFNIYDIFYNDNNQLIIVMPYISIPYVIKYILLNKTYLFEIYICPHNHTIIYNLNIEYTENIKILINDEIIESNVNKYPVFQNDIILSTLVKNEDYYIKSWIDYHFNIGISRFIIYDNSNENTLSEELDEYIKHNIVLLIKWTYPYILNISGISGQTTQQNHSIYAFQNSKYIGLFDIDEYINMQNNKNINSFFDELIINNNIDINSIGSFQFLNKYFYNPQNIPIVNNNFLKIFNCDNITENGAEKNFVIPKNVNTFSVHMITSGKSMYKIDKTYAYFNHYYYLNKNNRGRNQTDILDTSIITHLDIQNIRLD